MVFQIECAIEERYDVVVCGGGPAGVSAALCAARNGANVALSSVAWDGDFNKIICCSNQTLTTN